MGGLLDAENFYRAAFLYDDSDAIDEDGLIFDKDAAEKKGVHIIEQAGESFEPEFFELLTKDREILLDIQRRWEDVAIDYKLETLKEKLRLWLKENPKRKIVIFSEFADTADYLGRELKKKFRAVSYTSKNDKARKDAIINDFDASKSPEERADNYDILIAMDTLSEGVNLHRAGIIVNYDIPYNPTRVIQRVGRINRIGVKNFDKLYIHNFIPRLEAQKETKNWQIANFKMDIINAVLGNDSKTLNNEEDIKSVFSIHSKGILDFEGLSWDTHYRNIYTDFQEKEPLLYEKIQKLLPRLEIGRAGAGPGLLEVRRVNADLFTTAYFEDGAITHSVEDVFKLLKAEAEEAALLNTDNLFVLRHSLKNRKPRRNKNYSHDALLTLKQFLGKCPIKKDQEYLKTIREMGEKSRLSLNTWHVSVNSS